MKRLLSRRTALAAATILPVANLLPRSAAADGPWKPSQGIRIIVPAAPGGTTDIVARLLAAFLQQAWGQSCVVDNKSGAGGVIGSNEVVKANPDGTTALMGNIGPQSIAYSLYRNMPYGPKSLAPVSCVITAPNVLVVHPSVPAKTVPEFVAWLKAQNGKVSYASSGTGQSPHLSAAWFLQLTGTKAEHIPYRGAAPALQDVIGGRIPVTFSTLSGAIGLVRDGKLRPLAVAGPNRSEVLPGVPTLAELGLEIPDTSPWYGFVGPARMPQAIVRRIASDVQGLLLRPELAKRIVDQGGAVEGEGPEEFAARMRREVAENAEVAKIAGIKVE